MSAKVTVYRFRHKVRGYEMSPKNMMATAEAIAALGDSVAIEDSARVVDAALLESGFLFERGAPAVVALDTIQLPVKSLYA